MHDKAKQFYVIIVHPEGPMVLMLDQYDLAGAKRAISWQRRGGFQQMMHICRYDAEAKNFVDDDGNRFAPVQSPYTDKSWNEFLARHGAENGFQAPASSLEQIRGLIDEGQFTKACRIFNSIDDDQELERILQEFPRLSDYDSKGNYVGAVPNENGWTP